MPQTRRWKFGSDKIDDPAEAEGQRALTLVREFEHQSTGWFWQTDRDGALTYLSDKVALLISAGRDAVLGQQVAGLFRTDAEAAPSHRTLGFHLSSRTAFQDVPVRTVVAGTERWWSITGRPVIDDRGQFQGFVGNGSDLTEKRRAEAEIARLALYDALTGLSNRQRMKVSLDQMLAQSRLAYRTTALLLLDLDRFKAVNDTLGHQTGDALLQQVAQRLSRCVGEVGLVGRIGGDEFQVLLSDGNRERLAELASAIINALSQPYLLAGTSITIGCSVGIALAPDDGEDSDTLVRNADLALYAAKADGRGVHRFFHGDMLIGAQNRKRLEEDLRIALTDDQLSVAYQPVVSTRDEQIVGYEALVRWQHPVHGAISPVDFIPVAEECGLIETLGEWVLRTATREAAAWPDTVRVAVNVSPIQFANPALPSIIINALAASGLPPHRLELEITESVFLTDTVASEQMFARLKSIGVRLALDDFGTGYSSLGYLRNAPFDKIKIDQSFVRGAAIAGNRNAAIIQAIVTLANVLQMETTAEGVEIQDEIELIRKLGCSHIQGYVYGKPMPAEAVAKQLGVTAGKAVATGHRISRVQRVRVLRRARIEIAGVEGQVRIRNLSSSGAMIDGVVLPPRSIGSEVQIELYDGQMVTGTIRWAQDTQAGIEFRDTHDLDLLQGQTQTQTKRAASGR